MRWSNRSPRPPATNCSEPSGSSPESTISSTSFAVRNAVGLAGLISDGTPARNAGASFSSGPQTGKLNALICTATPRSGVQMCWPTKVPPRPSGSTGAVDVDRVVGQLAAALATRRPAARRCRRRRRTSSRRGWRRSARRPRRARSRCSRRCSAERLEQRGPLVEGQLPQRRAADPPAVAPAPRRSRRRSRRSGRPRRRSPRRAAAGPRRSRCASRRRRSCAASVSPIRRAPPAWPYPARPRRTAWPARAGRPRGAAGSAA